MTETTINKSILNKNNFRLLIDKVPTVEYYVKSVNIPSITFAEATMQAGVGIDAYFPGDKIEFGTLDVSFLVDEDLQNFKERYDWMDAIVPFRDPSKYKAYTSSSSTNPYEQSSNTGNDLLTTSMVTLVVNTNKNIPNKYIRFHDAFPISLGGLSFESGAESETISVDASFRFAYYEIESTS